MRFEHEGMALWFGTPDAPAPTKAVAAGEEIAVMIGVKPTDASNRIEVCSAPHFLDTNLTTLNVL